MANSDRKPPVRSAQRQERLASALRANLHRRKAAARAAAKSGKTDPASDQDVPPPDPAKR
ncbi:MAG: hypothetical protein KGO02_25390 [Alphaproteobacteria bacterium]|nr:hypothetical protein [Alphaproteobacteria bacterium]